MIYKINYIGQLIIICTLLLSAGCSGDDSGQKYNEAAEKFNIIYFDIAKDLDTSDAMKTIEALQSNEIKKNIEELGKLLAPIEENIPESKEILYKKSFKKRYDELVFLKDSYSKFNELSFDEKIDMGLILVNIGVNNELWENKRDTWK